MLKGKLDLLSNTNMVDFAMDVHKTLYPDQEVPQCKIVDLMFISHMSLCMGKPTIWVPTRADTNRAVQSQKMARGWKFWI